VRSRHQGQVTITDPTGRQASRAFSTLTCAHCQRIVAFAPGKDIGGFCMKCCAPICGPCADAGTCRPIEKWLDQVEREAYRKAQNCRIMGLAP